MSDDIVTASHLAIQNHTELEPVTLNEGAGSMESIQLIELFRGTQRIVSVKYLFGRPVIASNFRLGKCHLDLS